ncbi:MAG: PAS domain-containing protein [bacterium]
MSEEIFRTIFDKAGAAILITDALTKSIIDCNLQAQTLTGYGREKLIGMKRLELCSRENDHAEHEKIYYSGQTHSYEDEIKLSDSTRLPVWINISSASISGKDVIIELLIDMSKQKNLEDALWESEQNARDLWENVEDLIQSVRPDGTFAYVNKAWRQKLGYTPDEITKLTLFDVIHPDSKQHCRAMFDEVLSGKSVDNISATFVTKEGQQILVEGSANCRFVDGKPVATRAIFHDVTRQRSIEKELRTAAMQWKDTFDAISDLVFVQDTDHTIRKVNKSFADAMKMAPDEIIGRKCYELLHNSEKPWPKCPFEMTKADCNPHTEEVDDPSIGVPLLVTTSPIFDAEGEMIGIVHIAKDISDIKKAENELRWKMHDLEVFRKASVGREMKMIKMKKRINELEKELEEKNTSDGDSR